MLPDVLGQNLKVVFCRTAAGEQSARKKAYYAGPGNKFWWILYRIGLTPVQSDPSQYKDVLIYGIGLTDLAKNVSGADSVLSKKSFDSAGLEKKILKYSPKVLCFNGKRAAQEYWVIGKVNYGLQDMKIGDTMVYIAPSTSGAANRYWDENYYFQLANLIKREIEKK